MKNTPIEPSICQPAPVGHVLITFRKDTFGADLVSAVADPFGRAYMCCRERQQPGIIIRQTLRHLTYPTKATEEDGTSETCRRILSGPVHHSTIYAMIRRSLWPRSRTVKGYWQEFISD